MAWQDDFTALSTDQQRATLRAIGDKLAKLNKAVEAKAAAVTLTEDEPAPLPATVSDLADLQVTAAALAFVNAQEV